MDSQPGCSDTHCTPSTGFYSLARRSPHTHLCRQLNQPSINPYSHLQFPIHTLHRDVNLMYELELSRMTIASWPKGRNVCFWDVFWVPSSLYSGRHVAIRSDTSCTNLSTLPCVQWDVISSVAAALSHHLSQRHQFLVVWAAGQCGQSLRKAPIFQPPQCFSSM